MYMLVCLYIHHNVQCQQRQNEESGPLEPKLQVIVNHWTCVLGTKPRSSSKVTIVFSH